MTMIQEQLFEDEKGKRSLKDVMVLAHTHTHTHTHIQARTCFQNPRLLLAYDGLHDFFIFPYSLGFSLRKSGAFKEGREGNRQCELSDFEITKLSQREK